MAQLVFFGTPEIAATTLAALLEKHTVVAVFTEPDRPAGRGLTVQASPVKQLAQEHQIPVLQPANSAEITPLLKQYPADVAVIVAYGQIIKEDALNIPHHGFINIHPSLLPKYRGAAPVQHTILNGDSTTGVTLMQLDKGMDSGPIIAQTSTPVQPTDTTETLLPRLIKLGIELLLDNLDLYLQGKIPLLKQDENLATYAPKLSKETGKIDWQKPADQIDRQVRACLPWPRAYTTWRENRLLILAGQVKDGQYLPTTVQLAGKNPQNWDSFCNGQRLDPIAALKELTRGN